VVRLSGGKGANQAAAAARLGAHVSLMATLGSDDSGEWLLDVLRGYAYTMNSSDVLRAPRARRSSRWMTSEKMR